jgi:hypothetical protein
MAGSPEQRTSSEPIEVKFLIDREGLEEMEKLRRTLSSRNLGTALYNAVAILNQLYDYQAQGYELVLKKADLSRTITLPTGK